MVTAYGNLLIGLTNPGFGMDGERAASGVSKLNAPSGQSFATSDMADKVIGYRRMVCARLARFKLATRRDVQKSETWGNPIRTRGLGDNRDFENLGVQMRC
jgi:hypothetical protein